MKIVLIGSGNVAWNLGKLFHQNNHQVVQVLSRNATTASALAKELNTESVYSFTLINKEADIYIIAVDDDAIISIANELIGLNKLIVHTSGAASMKILQHCSLQYGVLYPLQSLIYGTKTIPEIPFLIQGNTKQSEEAIFNFAKLQTSKVEIVTDTQKLHIHLAAVLVNNFTNHLYTLAKNWCLKNNVEFNLLLPLIKQTTNRLQTQSPALLQTGPAIRGDEATIATHLKLLKDDEKLFDLYKLFTTSLQSQTQNLG